MTRPPLRLLMLVIVAALLAACSGTTPQDKTAGAVPAQKQAVNPTPAQPAAPAQAPAGAAPTTAPVQGAPAVQPGAAAQTTGNLPYQAKTDLKGEVTFWHFWGSPLRRNAIRRVIAGFNELYPNIKVTETFVPFGEIWTKNIAAVTAGSGMPDVIVEDRPQLPFRALNKVDQGLGDLTKRDGIDGKGFWPFTWQETLAADGQPYGIPYETDIRVLYWNKAAFKDAGLDPEKPPKNWDELWEYADKLDKKGADGKLERIGFHPLIGGMGPDQWLWNNGGEPLTKDGKPNLNSKEVVETLAWIKKWDDRYGKANLDALMATFGPQNSPQDRFMSGKVAMLVDIGGYTSFLNAFNFNPQTEKEPKDRLGFGMGAVPPAPGKQPASLSGGFALSIPRGAKNVDAAWEFIKYATLVGQTSWARDTYSVPTVEKLAKDDPLLKADPRWQFIIDAMSYGRPAAVHPLGVNWGGELNQAMDDVRLKGAQPQQALDAAQQRVEAEAARRK